MTYDSWKTTNPADEFLGSEPGAERQKESYRAAVEQARLNAQLRKIEEDNADFYKVLTALEAAILHVDELQYPCARRAIDEGITLLQKRILHVVGPREARELSTDGRL